MEVPSRYEIRKECGRGRFSAVYHAWDKELQRDIALKVSATMGRSELELARIRRESSISCRLRHPAIVSGFDAVRHDGQEVLCLPLLTGGTMLDSEEKRQESNSVKITRLATVADAVHYMHLKGLIHGDIKPENVLLDDSGRPYLTDFGSCQMAKQPDADIVGTPAYLAPELVRGEANASMASDIYALGATLFELLCGMPPFQGEVHAVLDQVRKQSFPIPSHTNRDVHRSLNTITAKACAAIAADRYATAAEFSQDLRNYLADRPLLAKKNNVITTSTLWCRRYPLLAGLAATLVIVLMFGTTITSFGWWRSRANQRALLGSEQQLREQGEIAKRRESELATLLVSIQHEQAAIELASLNEKQLFNQAEAARVEINQKSKFAQDQLAEATRLDQVVIAMQVEQQQLGSVIEVANQTLTKRQVFEATRAKCSENRATLTEAIGQLPGDSGLESIVRQKWENFAEAYLSSLDPISSLGWRYIDRCKSNRTTHLPTAVLDAPLDLTRVVANRTFDRLLFLRSSLLVDLKFADANEQWQSVTMHLRDVAGLPRLNASPELAAFSADGSNAVVSLPSSGSSHDLVIVATSSKDIGSLITRIEIPFEGVVHAIRNIEKGRLYVLRSIRTNGDIELYSVFDKKVLWSCKASRHSAEGDVPLLPFFIQCGSDPWENLVFASSPVPSNADATTSVFLHSVDLRSDPVVTTFDCGQQPLGQWPHQWQLSDHHILGIGRQSLATGEPPPLRNKRFSAETTLTEQPLQVLTNSWFKLPSTVKAQPQTVLLESELFIPKKSPIYGQLNGIPCFTNTLGELVYIRDSTTYLYDIFENVSTAMLSRVSRPGTQYMTGSLDGTCVLAIGKTSVIVSRIAEWRADTYQSVDEINLHLAEVEHRFMPVTESSKRLAALQPTPKSVRPSGFAIRSDERLLGAVANGIKIDPKSPWTIETVVKLDDFDREREATIFEFFNHVALRAASKNEDLFNFDHTYQKSAGRWFRSSVSSKLPYDVGWTHVAVCFDGKNQLTMFVDGKLDSQGACDFGPVAGEVFKLTTKASKLQPLMGEIDSLRISNIARYEKDFEPILPFVADQDTVVLYSFDEGSGEIANDLSKNGFHAKVDPGAWISTAVKTE